MTNRVIWAIAIALLVFVTGTLTAPNAHAAKPCSPITMNDTTYRLAVSRVDCGTGAEIIASFYNRYGPGSGSRLNVQGYICLPGLAASQVTCEDRTAWIGASSRAEDHPAEWNPADPAAATERYNLGTQKASRFMRTGLKRHFPAFPGAGSRVRCNHRLAKDRLRCNLMFVYGDSFFTGKGQIWVTYRYHEPFWNYSWRIKEFDEYCLIVEKKSQRDCTTLHVVR